jgi:hypothetical protein
MTQELKIPKRTLEKITPFLKSSNDFIKKFFSSPKKIKNKEKMGIYGFTCFYGMHTLQMLFRLLQQLVE